MQKGPKAVISWGLPWPSVGSPAHSAEQKGPPLWYMGHIFSEQHMFLLLSPTFSPTECTLTGMNQYWELCLLMQRDKIHSQYSWIEKIYVSWCYSPYNQKNLRLNITLTGYLSNSKTSFNIFSEDLLLSRFKRVFCSNKNIKCFYILLSSNVFF